jgi:hypothetical protein
LGFLAAATTDVEDVDGGPPGGCWRQVRQRPPPKLETSTAGPLGVLAAGPTAATTEVGDVDGGPPDFHGDNKVSSAKKMLVVTSDPRGVLA